MFPDIPLKPLACILAYAFSIAWILALYEQKRRGMIYDRYSFYRTIKNLAIITVGIVAIIVTAVILFSPFFES